MRAHGAFSVRALTDAVAVQVSSFRSHIVTHGAARLEQFAVHVNENFAAGAFMQIIDILRDDQYSLCQELFQFCQRNVGGVGLDVRRGEGASVRIIKILHAHRISLESLRRRHIFDAVALPDAALAAKCIDVRFD